MDNKNMSQSTLLRELREGEGLAQEAVAKELGVSRPTYIALEQGKRELTLGEAQSVARMYGVPLDVIASGKKPAEIALPKGKEKKEKPYVRISVPQERIDKFKQVLLYLLGKTAGKPNVGETVLYKLLYFIDFDYYEKYGEQLMGLRYIRNHFGPSPRAFGAVVREMEKANEIEKVKSTYFAHDQKKYLPHKVADLSVLSGREVEMIDDVLSRYGDKNASELSALTHEDMPWMAAKQGQDIRYEHVFYRSDKLSVGTYDEL